MNKNILSVIIKKPISEVFEFSINPKNTHTWFTGIIQEKIDTEKTQIGTIYSSTSDGENWSSFVCKDIIPNKLFVLESIEGDYRVVYDYEFMSDTETKMTYTEYMTDEQVDLSCPFEQRYLDTLKQLLEQI